MRGVVREDVMYVLMTYYGWRVQCYVFNFAWTWYPKQQLSTSGGSGIPLTQSPTIQLQCHGRYDPDFAVDDDELDDGDGSYEGKIGTCQMCERILKMTR